MMVLSRSFTSTPYLRYIILHGNNIGDEGVQHLCNGISSLQYLRNLGLNSIYIYIVLILFIIVLVLLIVNNLTDDSIDYIVDSLSTNKNLSELYLKSILYLYIK